MTQKRVFWACEAVGFAPDGSNTFTKAHGVQSIGITAAFGLEPIFQLGEIKIYENVENIPDVEVTMEKVLDGYPLLYHLATRGSPSPSLSGRSNARSTVALSLYPDTNDSASGVPTASTEMSGMYPSSISYTFPVEGNCTESITLVGNHRQWKSGANALFSGNFNNDDQPLALTYDSGGVQRRENVLFTYAGVTGTDVNGQINATFTNRSTVLPLDIAGISASGTNENLGTEFSCAIQSISVSTDLGRTEIFELGRRIPYHRYIEFPVDVTTEIEILSKSGDWISAAENGAYDGDNTREATIKIATQDGTFINCGTKNRLSNITLGGGDTGGGNQTITYTFVNQNELTVQHHQDPG